MHCWEDIKQMKKLNSFLKEWKKIIIMGFFVLAAAFFLRAYNLNELPVFADEAIYVRWAQIMKAESTLRFLPLSDGKQPLFMWFVIPFLKVIADPLVAGRMVSVFTGLGTLIGIFVASYLLFKSKKVSLMTSLIYAISPLSVFFDRMALVDSMLAFFGIWTFTLMILLAKQKRLDMAMIAGFLLGGALLTKSPALFFVLLSPAILIILNWKKKSSFIGLGALYLITLLIGYGMYNILRLGPNYHMLVLRNRDYVHPYSHILTNPLDPFLPFFDRITEYLQVMGPWAILVLVLLGIYSSFKKFGKEILIVGIWALFPILAISEYSKTMTARYMFFTFPYIVILAGSVFTSVGGWTLKGVRALSNLQRLVAVIFIIFIFQAGYFDWQLLTAVELADLPRSERSGYLEEWTAGTGIKEASEYLKEEWKREPDKKIVVGTEGYFGTLPDGLQMYLGDTPEITVIGVGLELSEVPVPLVESKEFGNKTYLVVNDSRLAGDPDEMGLELLAEYPKAFRPVGSTEYNRKGPQEALFLFEVK